jgi:hypothetical protein
MQSIILEKEQAITQDPRGVSLSGDAIRILYDIGIGDKLKGIGHGRDGYAEPATSTLYFLTLYRRRKNSLP